MIQGRSDGPADTVGSSRRASAPRRSAASRRKASAQPPRDSTIAGVTISNIARMLFPECGLTKGDLAAYYEKVAEHMLPFLRDRPLSVVRCPKGPAGKCFFQKHLGDTFIEPIKAIRVEEEEGPADYLGVGSTRGIVTLVQFGVLEVHPWGATAANPDKPDLLTIDLDPGPGVKWDAVRGAAERVRVHLEAVGLECFLKTTGGKGLHVVVPLRPHATWDEAKAFCAAIARRMARDEPDRYVAVASKTKRAGKIFVDYLRNAKGATSVAPYSTRARDGAPVAVPLRWDELARVRGGDDYNTRNIIRRLSGLKQDPWRGFFTTRLRLTASIRADSARAVGVP